VSIGCFRTLPEGVKNETMTGGDSGIPMEKIKDFGTGADKYY